MPILSANYRNACQALVNVNKSEFVQAACDDREYRLSHGLIFTHERVRKHIVDFIQG